MVQLQQVAIRLKSIKNIQKITKTMKMVSASKCLRAEEDLKAARPFGYGPRKFYESTQLVKGRVDVDETKNKEKKAAPEQPPEQSPQTQGAEGVKDDPKLKRIYIAITSDRGLCGGVHSGVARRIRRELIARKAEGVTHKLICVGDKSRSQLRRQFPQSMLISCKDVGREAPVFSDASIVATAIANSGFTYDIGDIYYNKFFSALKYELHVIPIFNKTNIEVAPNMTAFDDVDEDELVSYAEWTNAALIYYALKEGAASELSARMAAMDNASKNAGEMIRKLTLLYNRTRQAVITRELIEIISGASALK